MATVPEQLLEHGQSLWLDYISRELITSGRLEKLVHDRVITGMTSNPSIFDKAISGSVEYEEQVQQLLKGGETDPYAAFVAIARQDIAAAADALRAVYDATGGADGFVSLEVPPGIEHDCDDTVAEARRLFTLVGRPNVMIKVPGTPAGIEALTELIADGVNVNVTLLFAVDVYERVAEGYIRGLERRQSAGLPVDAVASVASFFVSRLDTAIDRELPEGSPLRGKLAVANATVAYGRFLEIFTGPRWEALAAAGARVQRPLWASTGTKNPAYSDVLYVEELIAPHTVNTLPEATLTAVLDHARVAPTIEPALADARRILEDAAAAGVDLPQVTGTLLVEGLDAFAKDFNALLGKLRLRIETAPSRAPVADASLAGVGPAVDDAIEALRTAGIVERIWARDYTVWRPEPEEISNRLGWLDVVGRMLGEVDEIRAFTNEVRGAGFRHAVLLGMGGSSLAPEVLARSCPAPGLTLHVLDTTDPREIRALEAAIDRDTTLFIVASKSGTTIEPRALLAHFWHWLPIGERFIAITDPASELAHLARDRGFRRTFINPPEIGGRYSALSYFGLVPAALAGVDIAQLLWRAQEMLDACRQHDPAANAGAWLGAALAAAAAAGRDKLTLIAPPGAWSFGDWVEQLIAESTGKDGAGIIPVVGEPLAEPAAYGDDRLFVALGYDSRLTPIREAGHPVIVLPYSGVAQLGAEFVRWEFATAVAGRLLGIHPFDQPNVEEAKREATRALGGAPTAIEADSPADVLASLGPGDYLAITAFVPRSSKNVERLERARLALRDRFRVAVTVGFGPRYLHSTGQLHKGGPASVAVLQVIEDVGEAHDIRVPGSGYSLGQLQRAQADGDILALSARGRRVARLSMDDLQDLA